ncbi:Flagellin [Gammaproteobacteria bacterium MOLA455]|nr:Flagellin [Gammaproteobacteria bacterium MOLA455]
MTVINTNIGATITANSLAKNERAMNTAMERLSTGKRINSAADDAAGLAISQRLNAQVKGLDQAARNANDAISMLQTADGAAIEITNMLQRMRELAVQATSNSNTTDDVSNLDLEFKALAEEIDRIVDATQWNGENILDGSGGTTGSFTYQIGANDGQTIVVDFNDFNLADGVAGVMGADISGMAAATTTIDTSTANVITTLDTAISGVTTQRATFGAVMNRLEYTVDNLRNISQNTSASMSRIADADYAAETTELARTQIIQQAGTAMLSQANQQAQSVLALLK